MCPLHVLKLDDLQMLTKRPAFLHCNPRSDRAPPREEQATSTANANANANATAHTEIINENNNTICNAHLQQQHQP